jgi:hypothetical protein
MNYRFGRETPSKGAPVCFSVYLDHPEPGKDPIADYQGWGEFLGESTDGFMIKAAGCTDKRAVGQTVYVQRCFDALPLPWIGFEAVQLLAEFLEDEKVATEREWRRRVRAVVARAKT